MSLYSSCALRILSVSIATLGAFSVSSAQAATEGKKDSATQTADCEARVADTSSSEAGKLSLDSFFTNDVQENLALRHPFTVANAAEKANALIKHIPSRRALDPLYRVVGAVVYPTLAGEDPASGGRMVVGQEEAIDAFVKYVESAARGDRTGKSIGFPGPAGTGKTEILYVLYNLERNLGKLAQYRQFSYKWKGLYNIPYLKGLHRFGPDGKPLDEYFEPDLPRSPFTLLREDMQDEVLAKVKASIQTKWGFPVSTGWKSPEPKSAEILRRILDHEFPEIREGLKTVDDLTPAEYLAAINKYLVVVPKTSIRPSTKEPKIIRAQTDNPNYSALLASVDMLRLHVYGQNNPFSAQYRGLILEADGGLLMLDELFRNPPEFLNILLEVIQNHIAQTDFGAIELDILPIWNSNDESIEKAGQDGAIKALLNRTDAPAMRSLLSPQQIEAVMPFQVGIDKFKMRALSSTAVVPFEHAVVYPAPAEDGSVYSALGRYAIYYEMDGQDLLFAPLALNYMAWLSAASRFVIDRKKMEKVAGDLNLIRQNSGLLTNPLDRVRIAIGDRTAERADLVELTRLRKLVKEGEGGITARDIETWLKEAISMAKDEGRTSITPQIVDKSFQKLLDAGRIKPDKEDTRAYWNQLRTTIKLNMLLPKLDQQVNAIITGDGNLAERVYDSVEREFIALASDPDATSVIPQDGSEVHLINKPRLDKIRESYRRKFGRDFEPTFLLRMLNGTSKQSKNRDPNLLEAVRDFISQNSSVVSDTISKLDAFNSATSTDPSVQQKMADIRPLLASYGYDDESFKEALAFVNQLRLAESLERERQNRNRQQ